MPGIRAILPLPFFLGDPAMTGTTRRFLVGCAVAVVVAAADAGAQDARQAALASLDAKRETHAQVSQQIWDLAEMGWPRAKSPPLR
jgi:hypothetical protein